MKKVFMILVLGVLCFAGCEKSEPVDLSVDSNATPEYQITKKAEEEAKVPSFPVEKILTVSARDYCESVGKKLSDFRLVGIHTEDIDKNVPQGAEVVVDYRREYAHTLNSWHYGTALIPKESE